VGDMGGNEGLGLYLENGRNERKGRIWEGNVFKKGIYYIEIKY